MDDKTELKTRSESSFMKTGEASRVLGISQATVRAAVKRGDLPGIRLGSHFLIARAALSQFIGHTEHTTPSPGEAAEREQAAITARG